MEQPARTPNASAYIASEMKNPQRDLPRSLLIGTGLVVVLYVGLNVVFLLVESGVLIKEPTDTPEDFEDLFSFEEAFETSYPWGG